MSDLKKYLEIQKTSKIEGLTEFLNDQGKWYKQYIDENPDFIGPYTDVLFDGLLHDIHLGELEEDTIEAINYCLENEEHEVIYNNCEGEKTSGIYRRSSEIASMNLGEQELQFSGLYDHDTKINCIYSKLCEGMAIEEQNEAINNCDFFVSSDCIYIDCSYDRASIILNEEQFLNDFINLYKKAV